MVYSNNKCKYVYSVLLVLIAISIVVESGQAGQRNCAEIASPKAMMCCKNIELPGEFKQGVAKTSDCIKLMKPPPSCEMDICIAKKTGIASDSNDGSFVKRKVLVDLKKSFGSNPKLLGKVKKNCLDADLSKFGPAEYCDLMKLRFCLQAHLIESCTAWDRNEYCSGIRDLVHTCVE